LKRECADIVGKGTTQIWQLPPPDTTGTEGLSDNIDLDDFWNVPRDGSKCLKVIATPFRPGKHFAQKPEAFIPVIEALEKLHDKGLVHGDIRGFNVVFHEGISKPKGYLIDFDFGGQHQSREYPEGYVLILADGVRCVDNEDNTSRKVIRQWHDWFALGRLIFVIHELEPPEGRQDDAIEGERSRLHRKWEKQCHDITTDMIHELKVFLKKAQAAVWTVRPTRTYKTEIDKIVRKEATNECATVSPP
jgi:hypothetical protein